MRVVRGQLSDNVLCILANTADQRRADPLLVPQSNEAQAWRGGDDAASVIGIAFGSEHRQVNPSEIRTEPDWALLRNRLYAGIVDVPEYGVRHGALEGKRDARA